MVWLGVSSFQSVWFSALGRERKRKREREKINWQKDKDVHWKEKCVQKSLQAIDAKAIFLSAYYCVNSPAHSRRVGGEHQPSHFHWVSAWPSVSSYLCQGCILSFHWTLSNLYSVPSVEMKVSRASALPGLCVYSEVRWDSLNRLAETRGCS